MRVLTCLASCLVIGVLSGTPLCAGTVYNNGPPHLQIGYPHSDFTFGSQYADDFVLNKGASTIRGIHWFGSYGGGTAPGADNFVINIYPDDEDRPPLDDYLTVNITAGPRRVRQGVSALPGSLYRYSVVIDPVVLEPNTRHWLSIINTTTSGDWLWASSVDGNGRSAWRPTSPAEDWRLIFGTNANVSFELTSDGTLPAVPEPGTMCLAVLGAIAIWVCGTRRCGSR
jgi:hypothetical protein